MRAAIIGTAACAAMGCQPVVATTAETENVKQLTQDDVNCLVASVIEDGENNDHQVVTRGERDGYIYSFADDNTAMTPVTGKKGGRFAMSEGGANGSAFAARIRGKVAAGSDAYAGVGFNFADPKGSYDASQYEGLAFFARSAKDLTVRLKVPDASTDPDGGKCSECFNDFGTDFEVGTEWRRYEVPFATMQQMEGWGNPRPASVAKGKLYGVQFQVNAPGADFDLWIDDVMFTGCL